MKEIRNVILCGLGAIGSIYAAKLQFADCDFRILVDKSRYERYTNTSVKYNNTPLEVKYILPEEKNYKADLIIIATKMPGLDKALDEIENFVYENTIILSLLNGVTSELIIANRYGWEKILYAYVIGHSSVRNGNNITHDNVNTLVFGTDNKNNKTKINEVKKFFDKTGINYELPDDIKHSLWLKFMLNVATNQTTALFRMNFGELLNNKAATEILLKIMKEVQAIAKAEGINNTDTMIDEAFAILKKMSPEGRTSMLQDIEAKRKTEVDMFAGTVIEFGQKHHIETPYCEFMKDAFAAIHEQFDMN